MHRTSRIEITNPEDFVRDVLRSYPRYAIDANVGLIASKSQVTSELLVAAPRSARERVQAAIQQLAGDQRLGVNQVWATPVEEWLRLHPERKLECNINLLESLCCFRQLDLAPFDLLFWPHPLVSHHAVPGRSGALRRP